MKRLHREINIFSISALDLFASAMGAFILLAIILFPYYLNNAKLVEKMSTLRQELEQTKASLAQAQQKLRQTFLAVVIKWATNQQDIDLHVIDADGNEFYFKQHNRHRSNFRHSSAELSVDTTKGPGIEIWENPSAKVGRYKIYANLYTRHSNLENPVVKSTIYYRDGSKKLPDITLTQKGYKQLIAIVEVGVEGDVIVH